MTKTDIIKEEYYKNPSFNRRKLAKKLDVRESYIRAIIRPLKKNTIEQGHKPLTETMEFNRTSQNTAKLDLESITVTTVDQALEIGKVDLTQWEVDRHTIGTWQVTMKLKVPSGDVDEKLNPIMIDQPKTVTMYKIQVWLKKRPGREWIEAIRGLIKEIPKMKTPRRSFEENNPNYLLEIALMDVHFGLLAWGKETGGDYDIDIAEDVFLYAVQDLLQKASGFRPSRILFPIGNDFLHIDDSTNTTPQNHNRLDVDTRLTKIYQKAKQSVIKAVNFCREVAPVDLCWVPGNHDPSTSYYLCDVIHHIFEDDPHVNVDVSPKYRKFYTWGDCLVAYTHGSDEPLRDLPAIIATEERKLWGESIYREIHIGHTHKKKEIHWVNVDTMPGTVIRTIPSIAGTDHWHYKKGYVKAFSAAESYLWDAKRGMIGQFTSFVPKDRYKKG